MLIRLLIALTLCSLPFISTAQSAQAPERGDILSYELEDTYAPNDIRALYQSFNLPELLAPITYGLDVYKIIYWTEAATGDSLTRASGLAIFPQDSCDFPILNYNHGTYFYGDEVTNFGFEWFAGVPLATSGYILVMPDYLGYGETPIELPHPYLHAHTEASTSIDMIRATKNLLDLTYQMANDQLFLMGYSQGGHVTMATHREIESNFSSEFQVTAVAPCSGPYDVSGVTANSILVNKPSSAYLLGFTLISYQFVYGNLYSQPSDAFRPPYDVGIPQYFHRPNPQTNLSFPDTANRILNPMYLQDIMNDTLHPARRALAANDVYDWAPQAPVRMYYCEADELVPFQNTILALNKFQQNGASNVSAVSVNPALSHTDCFFPSLLFAKAWFDTFQGICILPEPQEPAPTDTMKVGGGTGMDTLTANVDTTTTQLDVRFTPRDIQIYPNPASETIAFDFISAHLKVGEVRILSMDGKIQYRKSVNRVTLREEFNVSHLDSGFYIFAISLQDRTIYKLWQKM